MIQLNYASLLTSQNIRAFERVIREGESSQTDDAYRMRYGGWDAETKRHRPTAYFDDFSAHPRVMEPTPTGEVSSAAGWPQITWTTWSSVCMAKYGLGPSFGPYDQDCAYVALLHHRGALDDVVDGRFDEALRKCRSEWASLPGSTLEDGGSKLTYARARAVYSAWGGSFSEDVYVIKPEQTQDPAPIEDRGVPAQQEDIERINAEEAPMAAPMLLIGPILQVITQLIPALGTLFGKDAEKYKDKIGAATQVVDIVTRAVGGTNAQDAVEKIQADPAALQAAKVAVLGDPVIGPMLTEVGGGIQAAHQRNMDAAANLPIHKNPAFWISLLLLPMAYYVVIAVIGVPWDGKMLAAEVSQEVRSMVIGGIMGTVVGGIVAFWMGTSYGSARKTDMLASNAK